MRYPTIFHLISSVCSQRNISCVLIGGFAVNHYKVTRQTADVDFLITKSDFHKIINLLEKEGFKQECAQEAFARLTTEKAYLMDLDFMFVDKETLDKIIGEGNKISIAEREFIVPCLLHLIALKLHAIKYNPKIREYKDFTDIVALIKVNKINARSNDFKDLCLKYGTEELYHKILERV